MTVAGEGAIVSKNLMLNTPGPGKYQINEEKGKTFKFTKDEKMKSLKSFFLLGQDTIKFLVRWLMFQDMWVESLLKNLNMCK